MVTAHWIHLVALLVIGICIAALTPWCKRMFRRFMETEFGGNTLHALLLALCLIGGWFVGWHGTAVALACTLLLVLIVNAVALAAAVFTEEAFHGPGTESLIHTAVIANAFICVAAVNAMLYVLTQGLPPLSWSTFFR